MWKWRTSEIDLFSGMGHDRNGFPTLKSISRQLQCITKTEKRKIQLGIRP